MLHPWEPSPVPDPPKCCGAPGEEWQNASGQAAAVNEDPAKAPVVDDGALGQGAAVNEDAGKTTTPVVDEDPIKIEAQQMAKKEIQKYFYGLVASADTSVSVEALREKHIVKMEMSDVVDPDGGAPTRMYWLDGCVHAEASDAYLKHHSAFGRKPGADVDYVNRCVEITKELFVDDTDIFVCPTASQKKVATVLNKAMTKGHAIFAFDLLPVCACELSDGPAHDYQTSRPLMWRGCPRQWGEG